MDSRFDRLPDRQGSDSIKWRRYDGEAVIPMWVADMDFAVAAPIQEALNRRIAHPVYGYASVPSSLKAAAQDWLAERWGWSVPEAHLVALPAVVPGIHFLVRALGRLGCVGGLAYPSPVYPPIRQVAQNLGLNAYPFPFSPTRSVTLAQGNRGGWDLDQLARACEQGADTLLLSHPHNPIGQRVDPQQREALTELVAHYGMRVISDEIHGDLILDGLGHCPLAKDPRLAERTATLFSAGKSFNLAGLPFAFAVVPDPKWRQALKQSLRGQAPAHNVLAMVATEAAWREGGAWLDGLLDYLAANRERVSSQLAGLAGVRVHQPDATYLAWIDCRGTGSARPAEQLRRAGVGVSDGTEFGAPGFVRLNFGCPRELLDEGLQRFRRAFEQRA
ncbi:PatB family C-S lyase [Ferrimonas gelatinilytica]|uniref:cysteine-S-conjugate beta-lyase n=1 Tax=Ferrimonas gelatinilytica TaxID=1255257 RepID=A0ABP9RYX9_9GAMM